jgi:hypothetical protein
VASRAVYSFSGFPELPVDQRTCHLYYHHDAYPAGAAWRFAASLRHGAAAESFLAAFRHTQAEAIVLAGLADAAEAVRRQSG